VQPEGKVSVAPLPFLLDVENSGAHYKWAPLLVVTVKVIKKICLPSIVKNASGSKGKLFQRGRTLK
jgi:hypothetical protein